MQYEFYIDAFVVTNGLMDFLVLMFTDEIFPPGTIVVHWLWRFGCALYFIRGLCFQDQLELLIQNDVEKILLSNKPEF